jgi:hypothetical protein
MPDSFGKRNRDAVKARKAAARDDRRIARNQRRNQRGITVVPEPDALGEHQPDAEDATGAEEAAVVDTGRDL